MPLKVDLAMKVLGSDEEPSDRWCKAGHVAENVWIHPISGETMPMRFMSVAGPALEESRRGVYCEECVAKANKLARQRR